MGASYEVSQVWLIQGVVCSEIIEDELFEINEHIGILLLLWPGIHRGLSILFELPNENPEKAHETSTYQSESKSVDERVEDGVGVGHMELVKVDGGARPRSCDQGANLLVFLVVQDLLFLLGKAQVKPICVLFRLRLLLFFYLGNFTLGDSTVLHQIKLQRL